jgi:hypothetical protein
MILYRSNSARLTLANALLSIASDDSRDVAVLKQAALQVLARNYLSLPIAKAKADAKNDGALP